jgi:hypothetical protein
MIPTTVLTALVMLFVLTPATAAPMPAVKSAQCPPGHMQSGGYCLPLIRPAPAAAPKLWHSPARTPAEWLRMRTR